MMSIPEPTRPIADVLTRGLLILLCLIALGCERERPNLLVITLDTTRADRLGAYGYERAATPNIDALAAEGFIFRGHMTPVPITLPSHTSLFTGRLPPTHTVHDNGMFTVPAGETTLAEVLAADGFHTAAFIASFPLTSRFGLDQGFDLYDEELEIDALDRYRKGLFFDERPAGAVVDATLEHLRSRGDDEAPFFLFVHFFDPHQPQIPPPPYDLRFRDQPYDGEIAYVDAQLGRLFEFLRATDQWDDTLIVVTADHGEALGEHGELTHAILLHQATLHIPLILRGPGVPVGETSAWTMSTQVMATALELLGFDLAKLDLPGPQSSPPELAIGRSLLPLIENDGVAPTGWPIFEGYFETIAPLTSQGWSQLVAWMKGDWRYVHAPRPELYDLASDPRELVDQIESEPRIASSLLSDLSRALPKLETVSVGAAQQDLDAESIARLAALGYLQAGGVKLEQLDGLLDVEGRIDPKDRVADISLFSEAKAAMAEGRWLIARRLWQRMLERSPTQAMAYVGLAQLHAMAREWPEAFELLEHGRTLLPDAEELSLLHAELSIEFGDLQKGLDILAELPTDSVRSATWRGTAHARLGERQKAIEIFRAGIERAPGERWLRLYLANQLATGDDAEQAEASDHYRHLMTHHPYFHLSFYNYAQLLIGQGDRAGARRLLERARRLAPEHELSRRALSHLDAESAEVAR